MQYSDLLAEVPDERQGPLARLEGSRRHRRRRPPHRLRHRHRPARASATAPTCSPPPACRPTARRSPRCSRATGTTTSRSARPVQGRDRQAVDRLRRLGAPGHDQPDRGRVRGPRRRRHHRHREPRGRGRSTTRSLDASAVASPALPRAVERRLVRRPGERRVRRRCSARAGCSASSRATPRASPAGTSRTSSPNGGGNWGGSYLTVPANGANVEEAQKLADWLTAPEQQIKAFVNAGTFPSQIEAYERRGAHRLRRTSTSTTHRPAQIFTDRAEAVTVAPYKGANYFQVNDALQKALTRVFDGTRGPADRRGTTWVSEVDAIG